MISHNTFDLPYVAGKSPDLAVEMGFDEFTFDNEEEFDDEDINPAQNFGNGKCFPGGPVCEFNGKKVQMLAQWSEGGGITAEILTNALRYMDKHNLFPREDGRIPFLLLDAHHSRYDLEFLQYINDDAHKWCVCIGVPYGTHLWQVADSEEQNGSFTNVLADEKKILLQKKWDTGTGKDLNRYDIIPCLNRAFDQSFRNKTTNLKAINDRGWGISLNRALLNKDTLLTRMSDEDRQREKTEPWGKKPSPPSANTMPPLPPANGISPEELNVNSGLADILLNRIIQHKGTVGHLSNLKKRKRKSQSLTEAFHESKKTFAVTGGTCVDYNKWRLDNEVKDIAVRKYDKKSTKERNAKVNSYLKYLKDRDECRDVLGLNLPSNELDMTQCKAVVRFLKSYERKGKKMVETMPGDHAEAQSMYDMMCNRMEPHPPPCPTDEEMASYVADKIGEDGSAACQDVIGVDVDALEVDAGEDKPHETGGVDVPGAAALLTLAGVLAI